MKNILTILLLSLFISCNDTPESKPVPVQIPEVKAPNYDYLLGKWQRLNDKEGKTTYEYWTKKSETEYIGMGCTLTGTDTTFKENLRIVKIGEEWNLEVTGVNEAPTNFLVTQQHETSFVSENEANEFPKIIDYWIVGDTLKARVAAGEMAVSFAFLKF
jgi:hypothetical protein